MTKWKRIAAGEYQTEDGRTTMWQIPDVYPPAWNVATVDDEGNDHYIVDGAASMRDAKAIFDNPGRNVR